MQRRAYAVTDEERRTYKRIKQRESRARRREEGYRVDYSHARQSAVPPTPISRAHQLIQERRSGQVQRVPMDHIQETSSEIESE